MDKYLTVSLMSRAKVNKFLSEKKAKATNIVRESQQQELDRLRKEEAADTGSSAPQQQKEPEPKKDYGEGNPVGNFFGAIDDAYMGAGRSLFGVPKEGRHQDNDVANYAGYLFGARPGAKDVNRTFQFEDRDWKDKASIIGNRALHAGGLTAAGAGLIQTGTAIANQFGGPADQQQNARNQYGAPWGKSGLCDAVDF